VALVEFGPVIVGKPGADLTNRLADELVIRVLGEVHAILRRSVTYLGVINPVPNT
jgi:hypothetical protein